MATTDAAVMARMQTVIADLGYRVISDFEFSRTPVTAAAQTVSCRYTAEPSVGGFGFSEEARGTVLVSLLRLIGNDYDAAQQAVLTDTRTIRAALVRDGAETSGEYAVEDGGQVQVDAPVGANYLIGRLRVPVNFEAAL